MGGWDTTGHPRPKQNFVGPRPTTDGDFSRGWSRPPTKMAPTSHKPTSSDLRPVAMGAADTAMCARDVAVHARRGSTRATQHHRCGVGGPPPGGTPPWRTSRPQPAANLGQGRHRGRPQSEGRGGPLPLNPHGEGPGWGRAGPGAAARPGPPAPARLNGGEGTEDGNVARLLGER